MFLRGRGSRVVNNTTLDPQVWGSILVSPHSGPPKEQLRKLDREDKKNPPPKDNENVTLSFLVITARFNVLS
jgi:hypothetical protein